MIDLAVGPSGMNGIGGHGMTLAIVDSSSGASAAAAMKPATVSAVAGRISIPPTVVGTSWSAYWNRVTTPKLPPPPRIAQNRSGCESASTWRSLAVGRDDLRREQRVDRQAELAHEIADPATHRDPADADGPGVAEPDGQAVLAERRRDLAGRQAGLGPGGSPGDVDVDRLHAATGRGGCRRRSSRARPRCGRRSGRPARARSRGRRSTTVATSAASATLTMTAGRRSNSGLMTWRADS